MMPPCEHCGREARFKLINLEITNDDPGHERFSRYYCGVLCLETTIHLTRERSDAFRFFELG
jgi:hypothetical protein